MNKLPDSILDTIYKYKHQMEYADILKELHFIIDALHEKLHEVTIFYLVTNIPFNVHGKIWMFGLCDVSPWASHQLNSDAIKMSLIYIYIYIYIYICDNDYDPWSPDVLYYSKHVIVYK
jgi:hypothetical protein